MYIPDVYTSLYYMTVIYSIHVNFLSLSRMQLTISLSLFTQILFWLIISCVETWIIRVGYILSRIRRTFEYQSLRNNFENSMDYDLPLYFFPLILKYIREGNYYEYTASSYTAALQIFNILYIKRICDESSTCASRTSAIGCVIYLNQWKKTCKNNFHFLINAFLSITFIIIFLFRKTIRLVKILFKSWTLKIILFIFYYILTSKHTRL